MSWLTSLESFLFLMSRALIEFLVLSVSEIRNSACLSVFSDKVIRSIVLEVTTNNFAKLTRSKSSCIEMSLIKKQQFFRLSKTPCGSSCQLIFAGAVAASLLELKFS